MGRTKGSVYVFTGKQARRMAEYGKAAQLMGMTLDEAAVRASAELGVPVSGTSVSRAMRGSISALRVPEEPVERVCTTLFEYAQENALEGIAQRLDEIIAIMRGMEK